MKDVLLMMMANYGMQEVDGPQSNPEILNFFKELGYKVDDDSTTAWCAASLNYYLKKCGYQHTGKLDARSFLKLPVTIIRPTIGDIAVLWREDPTSWKGHVGLFVNWNEKFIWMLGGNQGNSISIAAYPRDRVLGFRQSKKLN